MSKNIVAVFDLDGTITSKDTFLEFLRFSGGTLNYCWGLINLSPFIFFYFLGLIPNYKLKEKFFSHFFKGSSALEVIEKGIKFSENILPCLCRKVAIDILKWHTDQKHNVLILSASSDIWLKRWCELNNFEFIGTEFKVLEGKYTGEIKGKNCFGIQKEILLLEYFSKNNYDFSYGYGDSKSDQYFLKLTNQAYLMKLNKKNIHNYWKPKQVI